MRQEKRLQALEATVVAQFGKGADNGSEAFGTGREQNLGSPHATAHNTGQHVVKQIILVLSTTPFTDVYVVLISIST